MMRKCTNKETKKWETPSLRHLWKWLKNIMEDYFQVKYDQI